MGAAFIMPPYLKYTEFFLNRKEKQTERPWVQLCIQSLNPFIITCVCLVLIKTTMRSFFQLLPLRTSAFRSIPPGGTAAQVLHGVALFSWLCYCFFSQEKEFFTLVTILHLLANIKIGILDFYLNFIYPQDKKFLSKMNYLNLYQHS